MADKLLSILVPAYRAAKFLPDCIRSIQRQTYTNWEMLIVDDGSDDDLLDVAKQYAKVDHRVKGKRIQHAGHSIALNEAYAMASGELIGRQDADDWSEPSRLRVQVDELLNTGADLVSCLMKRVRRNGRITLGRDAGGTGCVPADFCLPTGVTKGPASATLISHRRVWERVGVFNTTAAGHKAGSTDSDWIFRCLVVDNPPLKWAHVHDELYCYRDHPMQCTKTDAGVGNNDHALFRDKYAPIILARLKREGEIV